MCKIEYFLGLEKIQINVENLQFVVQLFLCLESKRPFCRGSFLRLFHNKGEEVLEWKYGYLCIVCLPSIERRGFARDFPPNCSWDELSTRQKSLVKTSIIS